MTASVLADAVLALHLLFILYVVFGAALLWRWPRLVWLHLPAALWGVFVELSGAVCPLTPLENGLRQTAGEQDYAGSFVAHYLLPLINPDTLTRELQWLLGAGVVLVNGLLYARWLSRHRRQGRR